MSKIFLHNEIICIRIYNTDKQKNYIIFIIKIIIKIIKNEHNSAIQIMIAKNIFEKKPREL